MKLLRARRRLAGFTLLELMVSATVIGILAAFGVPRFQRAFEHTRVDIAGAHLESIWTAERLYKAQNGTFVSGINSLSDFLDSSFINACVSAPTQCGNICDFCYSVESNDSEHTTFQATANRNSCANKAVCKTSVWQGALAIDQTGALTGNTYMDARYPVSPAKF